MKTIKITLVCAFFIFFGQGILSQTTYVGSINLNKKISSFSLISISDTIFVKIDKKKMEFKTPKDFLIIKTKRNNYKLVLKGDTIQIIDSKKQIEFSTGLIFNVAKKKSKNLILNDKEGKILVNANFELKKGIAYFNIEIFDNNYLTELLSYSSYYLYYQSKNMKDSYDTSFLYFIFPN